MRSCCSAFDVVWDHTMSKFSGVLINLRLCILITEIINELIIEDEDFLAKSLLSRGHNAIGLTAASAMMD